jgi:hypothetical protein
MLTLSLPPPQPPPPRRQADELRGELGASPLDGYGAHSEHVTSSSERAERAANAFIDLQVRAAACACARARVRAGRVRQPFVRAALCRCARRAAARARACTRVACASRSCALRSSDVRGVRRRADGARRSVPPSAHPPLRTLARPSHLTPLARCPRLTSSIPRSAGGYRPARRCRDRAARRAVWAADRARARAEDGRRRCRRRRQQCQRRRCRALRGQARGADRAPRRVRRRPRARQARRRRAGRDGGQEPGDQCDVKPAGQSALRRGHVRAYRLECARPRARVGDQSECRETVLGCRRSRRLARACETRAERACQIEPDGPMSARAARRRGWSSDGLIAGVGTAKQASMARELGAAALQKRNVRATHRRLAAPSTIFEH